MYPGFIPVELIIRCQFYFLQDYTRSSSEKHFFRIQPRIVKEEPLELENLFSKSACVSHFSHLHNGLVLASVLKNHREEQMKECT